MSIFKFVSITIDTSDFYTLVFYMVINNVNILLFITNYYHEFSRGDYLFTCQIKPVRGLFTSDSVLAEA